MARLTGLPWVADLREPYLDFFLDQRPPAQKNLAHALAWRLGARFVSEASLIVTTTERFSSWLRAKYPADRHKVFTLPNGYDPDDFAGLTRNKDARFTLSYLGTLYVYRRRDPEPILRALSDLIRENELDARRTTARFTGVNSQRASAALHALRVLADHQPLQIPGKVFDYLGAGGSILCIAADDATADLIRETRGGARGAGPAAPEASQPGAGGAGGPQPAQ